MKLIKFGQIPTGTRFQDSGISYLKISMFFLKDDTLRHFGKAIIEGHASNEQQVTVEFASDDLVYVDDNVYQSIKEEYNLPYKVDPQQQTCKVCGRPDKFNFHVPDAVWEWIVPEEYRNHVVCLYCFDEFAHQKFSELKDTLYFAGKTISFGE